MQGLHRAWLRGSERASVVGLLPGSRAVKLLKIPKKQERAMDTMIKGAVLFRTPKQYSSKWRL